MTIIEFLFAVSVVGMIVLECIILLEVRNVRHTCGLRESSRRDWNREEHTVD